MRKNDERNPRAKRGSGENGSQNNEGWQLYLACVKLVDRFLSFVLKQRGLFSNTVFFVKYKNYDVFNNGEYRTRGIYIVRDISESFSMSAIAPILPSPDKLDRLSEVQKYLECYQHLERCLVSDSVTVGLRKFYLEVAQLKQEDLGTSTRKGFEASQKLIVAFKSLERTGSRAEKLLVWRKKHFKHSSLDSDKVKESLKSVDLESINLDELKKILSEDRDLSRFSRVVTKLHTKAVFIYITVSDVVSDYWDYLPVELQETLESFARQVVLSRPRSEVLDLGSSKVFDQIPEIRDWMPKLNQLTELSGSLAALVFKSVEISRDKPKLHLLELLKRQGLNFGKANKNESNFLALTEIKDLAQDLVQLSGVESVAAVAHTPSDLHRVNFHLKLLDDSQVNISFDTEEDLWEVAEKIALRAHRRLRKATGEKWYFHAILDEGLSVYPDSNHIIVLAHAQSDNPYSTS